MPAAADRPAGVTPLRRPRDGSVSSGESTDMDVDRDQPSHSHSTDGEDLLSHADDSDTLRNHDDPSDGELFPPLDRLGVLDALHNFVLPQPLERLQRNFSEQTRKVRSKSHIARGRMVEEWRRRVPSADEQLERYRTRMRASVKKLGQQWNDTKAITMREKLSFIFGVLNVFVSGFLIGGYPEYMHLWYTALLCYFMPIRLFSYHRQGYHYFLADLCYFVNVLLLLSLWVFPESKRLFIATFCLVFGNNAVAIILWRNSLVFHSLDKVTSLFIHIMPCATLHCVVHLYDPVAQAQRFPGLAALKHVDWADETTSSSSSSSAAAAAAMTQKYLSLFPMLMWSSLPYAVWQITYYFMISVRRREKIRAGRPTSFTWLRQSYSKTWIGQLVLSLPEALQEPAYMLIQYAYALCTMLPCSLWFHHQWASTVFLSVVLCWSVYNGATYYIDVFGKRFQKELEALKKEVGRWPSPGTENMENTDRTATESTTATTTMDATSPISTRTTQTTKSYGFSSSVSIQEEVVRPLS